MSKEQILKAELDKITDKVFSFGKPENRIKMKRSKNKKEAGQKTNDAAISNLEYKEVTPAD